MLRVRRGQVSYSWLSCSLPPPLQEKLALTPASHPLSHRSEKRRRVRDDEVAGSLSRGSCFLDLPLSERLRASRAP